MTRGTKIVNVAMFMHLTHLSLVVAVVRRAGSIRASHRLACCRTGTGKTLLARAVASNVDANFLKIVASAIVDKYIGESARMIREMFGVRHACAPRFVCF
jgi:ATP-dependent Zn protease